MADHVSNIKRSQIMASIKSKDTQPEQIIRKLLHSAGYRYRLHDKHLPGKPDIVMKKYNAVIFVHGCFWHGHKCKTLPKTRPEFWKNKIIRNCERDKNIAKQLWKDGWRICTIWQCAINRRYKIQDKNILITLEKWLHSERRLLEIQHSDQKE